MRNVKRAVLVGVAGCVMGLVLVVASRSVRCQPPPEKEAPEPAPPPNQTYTGAKQCSSCHFKQYMSWKKTKHAKEAFESLPQKYRKDGECLKCHSTGYGAPTGYKDESTANLAGTTCEACHGPGSEHDKLCKDFMNVKVLSPEQKKVANDSIYRILPGNVCQRCHLAPSHKEHPKYDKQ